MTKLDADTLQVAQTYGDKYDYLKPKVREWVKKRFSVVGYRSDSVYSICCSFQILIGFVPEQVLCLWLLEWGYRLFPYKGSYLTNLQSIKFSFND